MGISVYHLDECRLEGVDEFQKSLLMYSTSICVVGLNLYSLEKNSKKKSKR